MAWLLEFGIHEANSLLHMHNNDYHNTNRPPMSIIPSLLMPIFTSLNRLIGRVINWMIIDEKFSNELIPSSFPVFHYSLDTSLRFQLIRTFLQYLISMKPELNNEDYDGYVVNLESGKLLLDIITVVIIAGLLFCSMTMKYNRLKIENISTLLVLGCDSPPQNAKC